MALATRTRPASFIGAPSPEEQERPDPYTSEEFALLTEAYPDLRMERTAEGEVIIMPPTKTGTGRKNFRIAYQLGAWIKAGGGGEGFDSSTGFTLPNGAERSPDVSWVRAERWAALSDHQREEEFAPICPDFVIEIRSRTDRLSSVQKKMRDYLANGARLGWLIDPKFRRVEVYRPGKDVEILDNPAGVSGDPELQGFTLDLTEIFE